MGDRCQQVEKRSKGPPSQTSNPYLVPNAHTRWPLPLPTFLVWRNNGLIGPTEICRQGHSGKQSFLRSGNRQALYGFVTKEIDAFQPRRPGGTTCGWNGFPWSVIPLRWGQARSKLGSKTGRMVCLASHSTVLSCQNRKLLSSRLLGAGRAVPVGHREECQEQLSVLEGAERGRLHPGAAGQVGFWRSGYPPSL